MAYTYEMNHAESKNNSAFNCLLTTHTLNSIISLFVTTFLIAHIYSFNGNTYDYLFNVAIFNIVYYVGYAFFYVPITKIVDKTNRVIMYKIGIIIKTLLVISFIFFGESLAKLLVVAGLMNALGDGFYYASYNVLRQEMVSRKQSSSYASVFYILYKLVEVICPVILGALIDKITYSYTAIIVLVVCIAQIIVSSFVKSKRPEGSHFNLKEYFQILKSRPDVNKKIGFMYLIGTIYGASYLITALMNVCVMLEYGTNFSLGVITSIFSVGTILVIILMSKFTKPGKRSWLFIICGILPILASIAFVVDINQVTIIILNGIVMLTAIVFKVLYDTHRNSTLKEVGLYNEIAEHHCIIEFIVGISRGLFFAITLGISLLRNIAAFKALIVATVVICAIVHLLILIYEKKYFKQKESTTN